MTRLLALLAGVIVALPLAHLLAEDAPKLVITKATYGELPQGKFVDATAKVAAKVKDGKLRIEALNDLFGDPAEGTSKKLRVEFKLNDEPGEATVDEGETLLLPPQKLVGQLVIRQAVYGDLPDGLVVIVTDDVAKAVKDNALKIEASNDRFGDPASGAFKRLKVEYTIGGVELAKYAWEGNFLAILAPLK